MFRILCEVFDAFLAVANHVTLNAAAMALHIYQFFMP